MKLTQTFFSVYFYFYIYLLSLSITTFIRCVCLIRYVCVCGVNKIHAIIIFIYADCARVFCVRVCVFYTIMLCVCVLHWYVLHFITLRLFLFVLNQLFMYEKQTHQWQHLIRDTSIVFNPFCCVFFFVPLIWSHFESLRCVTCKLLGQHRSIWAIFIILSFDTQQHK